MRTSTVVPSRRVRRRPDPLLRDVLGGVLRAERTAQARTLSDVATAARVSLAHLSEVERGRKEPSSEVLAAICGALGLDLADLLLRTGRHVRDLTSVTAPAAPAAGSFRAGPGVSLSLVA
ncbi:helix-turn-helix domain-containing protein [Kineococcus sp. TBRC 1896]|uniref:Helix-turn-helix domain-containing protein n=1 Tax=Kineococcus mangrovi TaxID=1660183 RepID=A0ABV4I9M6_9ACTN